MPKREDMDSITNRMRKLTKDTEFTLVTAGADRHGSWIWEAWYKTEDMVRSITVAVTGDVLEVWGAIDNEDRFGNHLLFTGKLGEPGDTTWEKLPDFVGELWDSTYKQVMQMDEHDMTESYQFPYPRPK